MKSCEVGRPQGQLSFLRGKGALPLPSQNEAVLGHILVSVGLTQQKFPGSCISRGSLFPATSLACQCSQASLKAEERPGGRCVGRGLGEAGEGSWERAPSVGLGGQDALRSDKPCKLLQGGKLPCRGNTALISFINLKWPSSNPNLESFFLFSRESFCVSFVLCPASGGCRPTDSCVGSFTRFLPLTPSSPLVLDTVEQSQEGSLQKPLYQALFGYGTGQQTWSFYCSSSSRHTPKYQIFTLCISFRYTYLPVPQVNTTSQHPTKVF